MIGPMRILRVILALIFVAFVLESVLLAIPGGGTGGGPGPPWVLSERNVRIDRSPSGLP